MRRGFLRFRFGKDETTNKVMEDFKKWLNEQVSKRQAIHSDLSQEKSTTTASQLNTLEPSTAQGKGAVSGPAQPTDFGVTPEQIAAYRPPPPKTPCSWSSWLTELLLGLWLITLFLWTFVALLAMILGWEAAIAVIVGLLVLWGMFRLSRNDPASRERRSHIEAYLNARARHEKAVREEELNRRRQREDYWRGLSGREFESEMDRLYKADGYSVETTPVTGDEGADLLLRRDGELIVVQCKRQDKPVGSHIVRDLFGTMYHFHASRAFLDATGGFTEAVRQYVRGKPIELHDLDYILSLQERLSCKPEPPEQAGK
ncbi:MAG: restriction endonuclease [Phycisphaerales bacterium]